MNNQIFNIKYYSMLIIMLCTISIFGQQNYKERLKEKVNAQKIAYITERLELTEEESQHFWPIYNSYQNEMEVLRSSMEHTPKRNMTEAESEALMNEIMLMKSKKVEIEKKYMLKMKSVIPAKKIILLEKSEREFKAKVISKIKERRSQRQRE